MYKLSIVHKGFVQILINSLLFNSIGFELGACGQLPGP